MKENHEKVAEIINFHPIYSRFSIFLLRKSRGGFFRYFYDKAHHHRMFFDYRNVFMKLVRFRHANLKQSMYSVYKQRSDCKFQLVNFERRRQTSDNRTEWEIVSVRAPLNTPVNSNVTHIQPQTQLLQNGRSERF